MTQPVLVNRATGESVKTAPDAVVNGLLAVVSDGAGTTECLLAQSDGQWSAEFPAGRHDAALPSEVLPSLTARESLASIAVRVVSVGQPIVASAVSPLVPASRRGIELKEEDLTVRDALPYLASAALRPYSRLTRLALVAPVGRARRLDPRALARLAAHSEDWGNVTRSGVQPRQVLASVIDSEPDIYENALLVESLRTAHRYVWLRHQQTGELKSFYGILGDMLSTVEKHNWRTARRLYGLIGEAYDSYDEGWANEIVEELATLLRKLGASLATPLVRETRPLGLRPLHVTNLLTDDARYRWAYQLLMQLRRGQWQGDTEGQGARGPGLAHDHAAFCVLLVLRALTDLGGSSEHGVAVPGPGSVVEASRSWSVEWTYLNVVRVRHVSGEQLVVVPVQHALDADDARPALGVVLAQDCSSVPTLIGYLPSHPSLVESAPWSIDALPHEQSDPRCPGIAPLSPLDPRSELRITRALRRIELDAQFRRYGAPRTGRPETVRVIGRVASAWVQVLDRTSFALTAPPSSSELAALELALAPKTVAYSQSTIVSDKWSTVERSVREASADIAALRSCPVCAAGPAPFEPRQDFTFWCSCDSCGSRWGLRSCRSGHRFPVVVPGGATMPDRPSAGWLAETLGSFGIAMPCVAARNFTTFVCPECRVCPEAQTSNVGCARCEQLGR